MGRAFVAAATAATAFSTAFAASADVVVYGSTPAGVAAAVAAARQRPPFSVLLVDYAARVGGASSGGLCATDKGDTTAIGGVALEFFQRVGAYYSSSSPVYDFEPHVAESVFLSMLDGEPNIQRVATGPVTTAIVLNRRITSFSTVDGASFNGAVFIDASYEGDLLAAANISYIVGREPHSQYNESAAGRREPFSSPFDFRPVNPFDNNTGALLPLITAGTAPPLGSGDNLTQAYNFRLCVTSNRSNAIPWSRPAGYNSTEWELLRRLANALHSSEGIEKLLSLNKLPHGKFDMNNGALVSTDFVGGSWAYPGASYATRQRIWNDHAAYQRGLLWTLANDSAVPARIRSAVSALGLCADEFVSNGGWPEQLYVREARRIVGDAVFTQHDAQAQRNYSYHSIGMGSYAFDGHYIRRGPCIPAPDNSSCAMVTDAAALAAAVAAGAPVWTGGEGYPGSTNAFKLYQFPYSVLLPKRGEVLNFLSPVSLSASHVAYASLRVEPQYMILGHAAGVAAALSLNSTGSDGLTIPVQDVDERQLHDILRAEGAALCHVGAPECP